MRLVFTHYSSQVPQPSGDTHAFGPAASGLDPWLSPGSRSLSPASLPPARCFHWAGTAHTARSIFKARGWGCGAGEAPGWNFRLNLHPPAGELSCQGHSRIPAAAAAAQGQPETPSLCSPLGNRPGAPFLRAQLGTLGRDKDTHRAGGSWWHLASAGFVLSTRWDRGDGLLASGLEGNMGAGGCGEVERVPGATQSP